MHIPTSRIYRIGEPEEFLDKKYKEWDRQTDEKHGPDFRQILKLLKKPGPLIHIMGRAGSGKSHLIRFLATWFNSELQTRCDVKIVAPTGTAAQLVHGSTIHSYFQLPQFCVPQEFLIKSEQPWLADGLDLLIIDECSMVRADIMDAIDVRLRHNRKSSEPFGGTKVVLVGDPFQLPPVVTEKAASFLASQGYRGPHFFQAKVIQELGECGNIMDFYELHTAHRHPNPDFVDLLDCIRVGRNLRPSLETVNTRVGAVPESGPAILHLTSRRKIALDINRRELDRLPGEMVRLEAKLEGVFARMIDPDSLPAPKELDLKCGARVMFIRNHPSYWWVNGTLGIVRSIRKDCVQVELETHTPGVLHDVSRTIWQEGVYSPNHEGETQVIGIMKQFPLIPAWSITIHRSQGATLERIKIDMGTGAFAAGQAYVALSRCRSLDEIELAGPIHRRDVQVDRKVLDFYRYMRGRNDSVDFG